MKGIILLLFTAVFLPLAAQTVDSEQTAAARVDISQLALVATPSAESIALRWATARVFTSRMFYLERSLDGEQFTVLTQMNGRQSVDGPRIFSFVDGALTTGATYTYRVASQQPDGVVSYSTPVAVRTAPVLTEAQLR